MTRVKRKGHHRAKDYISNNNIGINNAGFYELRRIKSIIDSILYDVTFSQK